MKTTRELKLKFCGIHDIVIPEGTEVTKMSQGSGGFTVHPSRVQLKSGTREIFKHDAVYRYIWVPKDAVAE